MIFLVECQICFSQLLYIFLILQLVSEDQSLDVISYFCVGKGVYLPRLFCDRDILIEKRSMQHKALFILFFFFMISVL